MKTLWGVKIRCAFPKNADLQVGPDFWHPTGQDGDHGPFPRSLEQPVMQGKVRGGPRFAPFGIRNGLVCLLADARSTATAGGMAASNGQWPRTCDPEPVPSVEA